MPPEHADRLAIIGLIGSADPASCPQEAASQWRQARYAGIEALCLAHDGDRYGYAAYTLAAFGLSTLQALSDHQLEQTWHHLRTRRKRRRRSTPVGCHSQSIADQSEPKSTAAGSFSPVLIRSAPRADFINRDSHLAPRPRQPLEAQTEHLLTHA
jgi:hypothetical protein